MAFVLLTIAVMVGVVGISLILGFVAALFTTRSSGSDDDFSYRFWSITLPLCMVLLVLGIWLLRTVRIS